MKNNNNLPANAEFLQQLPTSPEGSSSLRAVLSILFRQKVYVLGFFIATFISVAVFTFISPEVYQSDAKLFIQLGRETMSVDPSVVGPTSAVRPDRKSELNSEVAALKSRVLAEQVVEGMGPNTILNTPEVEATNDINFQSTNSIKSLMV